MCRATSHSLSAVRCVKLHLHINMCSCASVCCSVNPVYPCTVISTDGHSLEVWKALWQTRFTCGWGHQWGHHRHGPVSRYLQRYRLGTLQHEILLPSYTKRRTSITFLTNLEHLPKGPKKRVFSVVALRFKMQILCRKGAIFYQTYFHFLPLSRLLRHLLSQLLL